jgi:hypothetical protein
MKLSFRIEKQTVVWGYAIIPTIVYEPYKYPNSHRADFLGIWWMGLKIGVTFLKDLGDAPWKEKVK